jgi:hypothetical protein
VERGWSGANEQAWHNITENSTELQLQYSAVELIKINFLSEVTGHESPQAFFSTPMKLVPSSSALKVHKNISSAHPCTGTQNPRNISPYSNSNVYLYIAMVNFENDHFLR